MRSTWVKGKVKAFGQCADVNSIDRHTCARLLSETPMPGASANPLKRMRRSTTLLSILAVSLALAVSAAAVGQPPGLPKPQKHERKHEIDQLEEAWRTAVLKSNTAQMEGLLADDYMAITASGTLQTKQQALDSLRSGRTHFTQLDISDRKVRFYGATALVTSLAQIQGTTSEGDVSGSYRYTRVYVRNAQGAWKVVSFEVSRIREPGERAEHK
jgi:ketosteroid isomerase-like protein